MSVTVQTTSPPASVAGLSIASGKTVTFSNTLTFVGIDGTTMTFPSSSAAIARTDGSQTFSGAQTIIGSATSFTPLTLISNDSTSTVGPILEAYRNSPSPAAGDDMFELLLTGQQAQGLKKTYGFLKATISDTAAISYSARLDLQLANNSIVSSIMAWGQSLVGGAVNDVISLPWGKLEFPLSQNASSNANTLDDYEEGTWTPTLSGSGNTFSYASQVGTYTKIGNMVSVRMRLQLNTSGNTLAANAISLSGLPFSTAPSPSSMLNEIYWNVSTTSYIRLGWLVNSSSTSGNINSMTAATTNSMAATAATGSGLFSATGGSTIWCGFTYMTAT